MLRSVCPATASVATPTSRDVVSRSAGSPPPWAPCASPCSHRRGSRSRPRPTAGSRRSCGCCAAASSTTGTTSPCSRRRRRRRAADVQPLLDDTHPDEIERCRWEADHVARAFAALDAAEADGRPFDVLHDHTGYAALAMADRAAARRWSTRCTARSTATTATSTPRTAARRRSWPSAAPRARTRRRRPARARSSTTPWPSTSGRSARRRRPRPVGRAHGARQGPAPRDRGGARRRACRSSWPGPCSPARRSSSRRRSSPTSTTTRVRYVGEVGADGKEALYGDARALLMPIRWRGAVRHGHGRGDGLRHAGHRLPGGLGPGGRRRTASPASSSRTRTRWRGRSREIGRLDRAALPRARRPSASASRPRCTATSGSTTGPGPGGARGPGGGRARTAGRFSPPPRAPRAVG